MNIYTAPDLLDYDEKINVFCAWFQFCIFSSFLYSAGIIFPLKTLLYASIYSCGWTNWKIINETHNFMLKICSYILSNLGWIEYVNFPKVYVDSKLGIYLKIKRRKIICLYFAQISCKLIGLNWLAYIFVLLSLIKLSWLTDIVWHDQ